MNFTLPYDQYLAIHRYKYLALYHAFRAAILEGILPGGQGCRQQDSLPGCILCRAVQHHRYMTCCWLTVTSRLRRAGAPLFQMTAFSCCRGEPVYREDSTDHQVVDLPRVGAGLNPAGEEFRTPDREFLEPVAIPLSSWESA